MSFEAPNLVMSIKDIKAIYDMNDIVADEIDIAIATMEDDIFIESSSIKKIKRFENILGITAQDTESLEDRRFRVKIGNNEQLPYSQRIFINKLNTMLGESGYTLDIKTDSVTLKVMLTRKSMFDTVKQYTEDVMPLNMALDVDYLYNWYELLATYTYGQLETYTYEQLRSEVLT